MLNSLTAASQQQAMRGTVVGRVLKRSRLGFIGIWIFSMAVNLFMLTGPLFMLQVYDRVLTSRSIPTLLALYVLIVALYGFLGFFNFLRMRVLSRISYKMDEALMGTAEKAEILSGLLARPGNRPVNDLSRLRQFMSSPGLLALFDLPWAPIYLAVVFYLHPWLGWLTLAGIGVVAFLTLVSELFTKNRIGQSSLWELEAGRFSDSARQNAEAIVSMGMMENTLSFWKKLRTGALGQAQRAGGLSELLTSVSKSFRLLLQSSILGLGAYLAVYNVITPGAMIAASIIGGRALAPIDQAMGSWKGFVAARQSRKRLNEALKGKDMAPERLQLPNPEGRLDVSGVIKLAPGVNEDGAILQGLNFSLVPGDGLGVIGPSTSGKTSLAKLLVGIWMPDRGGVRIDGATFDQWDRDILGKSIGYLPQSVSLMRGTISDNIARFDPSADDEDIIQAAKLANVHDMILRVPGGYAAEVGGGQLVLSGGQVQRIALARALFRQPALIVLDEPNSNLDAEGDAALMSAIQTVREMGSTVVVMAHRPSAIAAVNKLLMLRAGQQVDFGDKEEVLRRVTRDVNQIAGVAT